LSSVRNGNPGLLYPAEANVGYILHAFSISSWNGVHSALVRINEELLEREVAAPV
jgi:hypothetical protein